MIKEITGFTTYARMKNETKKNPYVFAYKDNAGNNNIVDLSELNGSTIPVSCLETIIDDLIKNLVSATTNTVYCIQCKNDDNGDLYSIDMDFRPYAVYSRKTGKRLYLYRQLVGYVERTYKPNIYGVIPDWEMPKSSLLYGTRNGLSVDRTFHDVEI